MVGCSRRTSTHNGIAALARTERLWSPSGFSFASWHATVHPKPDAEQLTALASHGGAEVKVAPAAACQRSQPASHVC